MAKFRICRHCGNLVGMINDSGVTMICCGEPMEELTANTTEAAHEKHLPEVTVEGDTVSVKVGSVDHPMVPEHYIEWIYLQTEHGGQRKALNPGDAPTAVFCVAEDKPVAVFAYCNLHGLWKTDL
ncbi:desulfoferrodoxin [Clostridium sp. chh4-2]|uniref:desulfoferrodoxin family protein n=1 Tax=Clostridium sp. chh4-2 TaxID=2067550 RepID=UPI000CCF8401|nr:desulfoferrodoxin family protein [Clostridium sp. chh4-2]PNV61065.1 desulfoferrodoxin [Clostridium sp. chh4-2]